MLYNNACISRTDRNGRSGSTASERVPFDNSLNFDFVTDALKIKKIIINQTVSFIRNNNASKSPFNTFLFLFFNNNDTFVRGVT